MVTLYNKIEYLVDFTIFEVSHRMTQNGKNSKNSKSLISKRL
jgi:hypothetical protein